MIRRHFVATTAAAALAAASRTSLFAEEAKTVSYQLAPDFIQPMEGMKTIGSTHGSIGVDSAGLIYVSVEGQKEGGIQVFTPEGKYLRHVSGTPDTLHGFVVRKDDEGEYIYATVLGQAKLLKMKLDGTVAMEIPTAAFPAEAAAKGLKLTNCDVAKNGDIFIVDGYGSDVIFVFGKDGKFKKSFAGKGEPLKLSNCHMIFVDTRFAPERLLLLDRGNNRILHTDLDGNLIGVVADKDMMRPSAASFHGDLMCVSEIAGRVSVFNKEGKLVAQLGRNDTAGETNTPGVPPAKWRTGIVTSPHGITFDAKGNIMESEWNQHGRVLRWNVKA